MDSAVLGIVDPGHGRPYYLDRAISRVSNLEPLLPQESADPVSLRIVASRLRLRAPRPGATRIE